MGTINFLIENWVPIVVGWGVLCAMALVFNYCASVASNGHRQ